LKAGGTEIPFQAIREIGFYENGNVKKGCLTQATTLKTGETEIPFQASKEMGFYENGEVKYGKAAETVSINKNLDIITGAWIYYYSKLNKIYIISPDDRFQLEKDIPYIINGIGKVEIILPKGSYITRYSVEFISSITPLVDIHLQGEIIAKQDEQAIFEKLLEKARKIIIKKSNLLVTH
jgi:hypothetical protein